MRPEMYKFDTFKEFADEFKVGPRDLVFTNKYIYDPYVRDLNLGCLTCFEEEYGLGEPSEESSFVRPGGAALHPFPVVLG